MNRSATVELREVVARESGGIHDELRYVQDALSHTIPTKTQRFEMDGSGVVDALRAFSAAALRLAEELECAAVAADCGHDCSGKAVVAVLARAAPTMTR